MKGPMQKEKKRNYQNWELGRTKILFSLCIPLKSGEKTKIREKMYIYEKLSYLVQTLTFFDRVSGKNKFKFWLN